MSALRIRVPGDPTPHDIELGPAYGRIHGQAGSGRGYVLLAGTLVQGDSGAAEMHRNRANAARKKA